MDLKEIELETLRGTNSMITSQPLGQPQMVFFYYSKIVIWIEKDYYSLIFYLDVAYIYVEANFNRWKLGIIRHSTFSLIFLKKKTQVS